MPSNMPTAQLRMPAPCLPQLPVSPSTRQIARSIRSPWYDLPNVQPPSTCVFFAATMRAMRRITSGLTPQMADAASGV